MKHSKKLFAAGLAATMAVNAVCLSAFLSSSAAEAVKYEFEDGVITGTSTAVENAASASGGKYVYMKDAGDTVTVTVNVESAGMYDLSICYNLPASMNAPSKIQKLYVNGSNQGELSFVMNDKFEEISCGAINLNAGENTIQLESFWGWTWFDYLTLQPANLTELKGSAVLSDKAATSESQSLMNYLAENYGNHILSGQQEIYGQADEGEFEYIYNTTGKYPAIRGFDFMNYNPMGWSWQDGTTERIIDWTTTRGGIATVCYHWFVPLDMSTYQQSDSYDKAAFYCNGAGHGKDTTFSAAEAVKEGTPEHEYVMESIKILATELKKVQNAGVPVIFRPLHEAQGSGGTDGSGCWFWWAADGAEAYKSLWKLLYTELTETYGLHNLIWEFNSYNYGDSKEWYPGDEYVDLVAYDKYNAGSEPNESAISSTFYGLVDKYDSKKMVALAECDTIPAVENMVAESAYWLYFCPWYGDYIESSQYNNPETLKTIYNSDTVITLDELPEDLYKNGTPPVTTTTKEGETTTTTTKTTTATTTTTKVEDAIMATVKKSGTDYKISFDREMGDKVYLVLDADESVTKANGCLGISVTVDGTDYWVSYKWEITKSGEVLMDLNSKPFEISYNDGANKVTDEAMIATITAAAQKQKEALIQVWWASDSTGTIDTTNVVLTAAYIPDNGGSETTTTTEDTTTTTEETTTTVTTVDTVETTTPETTTTEDTTETTTTTNGGDVVSYGDVNLDGKVDLIDAITMNKYMAGVIAELTPAQFANANCDISDGTDTVNEDDATALTNFVIMIEKSLPVNNPSTN